ncbi:MAG: hypothetical protein M3Z33_00050 [Actinomycetota bacterium]|nr:hypothetical protein [Actinomycetota bacterium]
MRVRATLLAAGVAAVAIAGCGDREAAQTRSSAERPTPPGPAEESARPGDPAAVRVIRGWADAQRSSNLDKASSYFALPSLVSNGTPPVRLRTRRDVRRFNADLPCGAQVVKTAAAVGGRYTIATFRLVSRPGVRCDGTGAQARTAFEIRGGKIRGWVRVADRPSGQAPAPGAPTPDPGNRPLGGGAQSI